MFELFGLVLCVSLYGCHKWIESLVHNYDLMIRRYASIAVAVHTRKCLFTRCLFWHLRHLSCFSLSLQSNALRCLGLFYSASFRVFPIFHAFLVNSYPCNNLFAFPSDASGVAPSRPNFFGRISDAIRSITGNKILTASDLDPILNEFKSTLMSKNVAAGVVDSLVSSVRTSLIGTKTESFTSVKNALKTALIEAMQKVLTQKKSVDVVKMANEAAKKGKVFSICFLVGAFQGLRCWLVKSLKNINVFA